MLAIVQEDDDQAITIKPAVRLSTERGVYLAPVRWTGQRMMFCITPKRLKQEFTHALADHRDLVAVFDPETYRGLKGEGVYLDYYGYTQLQPGDKSKLAYRSGVGICYVTLSDERYTRADLLRLYNGEELVADQLFERCSEQTPEILLEDAAYSGALGLPLLKYLPTLQETWLTFESDPDEGKQALLGKAGWQEHYEKACWMYPGQASVPSGIAFTVYESPRTISIEPTRRGYHLMKQHFEESVQVNQHKLSLLSLFAEDQTLNLVQGGAPGHLLFEEMVQEKRALLQATLQELHDAVAELEKFGY